MLHPVDDVVESIERAETEHRIVIDTVRCYQPVARDSVVVRYLTRSLPVDSGAIAEEAHGDSVAVVVPITQKEYGDSTYHAWVSGYSVELDSIKTYTRKEVTTVVRTVEASSRNRRWHIGVSAGYGLTGGGAAPYVGIGISYSLISF
jgi:hypothetical protein